MIYVMCAETRQTWPNAREHGMSEDMNASSSLTTVRLLLRDVLEARSRCESEKRLRGAHSFVDGYMRALLDTEQVTKQQLLQLVAEERARLAGPATREAASSGFEEDEGQLPVHAPDESGVRPRRAQQAVTAVRGAA